MKTSAQTFDRQLNGVVGALSLQFLLGMALATVADYDPETHAGNHLAHQIVLTLHVLLAAGILVGAVALLLRSKGKSAKLIRLATAGLLAVLTSAGTGIVRLAVDSEWLTFIMGTGFLVAVSVYGLMLSEVRRRNRQAE